MLAHAHDSDPSASRENIANRAGAALDSILTQTHVQIAPPIRNPEDVSLARMCLAEELAKLEARRGSRQEIEDAVEDLSGLADEGLTWRLTKAAEARFRADRSGLKDSQDLGEDREAMSKHLQNMIDGQIWVKKKG